jgi:hypothetical protein
LANWAAYAPQTSIDPPGNEPELLALCRRLAWKLTARQLRGANISN